MAAYSAHEFADDKWLRLAIERLVMIIGEAASKLTPSIRANNPQIPWSKIIGMRHIIVHDYDEVKLGKLYETSTASIPQLIQELEKLLPGE
jgi:uncharacterized protein with HEPN domain